MQPRIVSLQPSISVTLAALGRLHHLVGCTKYCKAQVPELADAAMPVFHDTWTFSDKELALLREAAPDLIVASVPYQPAAIETLLRAGFAVLALSPRTLRDIDADTRLLASLTHAVTRGEEMIAEFAARLERVRARAQMGRTIYCEEWGKPLIQSQPWVYELCEAAGAKPVGEPGRQIQAEEVAAADPDAIVLSWCGAGNRVPLAKVIATRGWEDLRAVREGRAVVVPDEFLNTPALPSLTDGLQEIVRALG